MLVRHLRALLLAGPLLLAACGEPSNLYIAHHTVVGVNAAMNTERTAGSLVIGYDRKFAAVIPRSVPIDGTKGRDAMAVISCSELEIDGIFLSKFVEYLATGEASKTFAKKLTQNKNAGASRIFECYDDTISNKKSDQE
jgi:hypothetical protein